MVFIKNNPVFDNIRDCTLKAALLAPLLYPLKTSDNTGFSDIFRRSINGILDRNGLTLSKIPIS